MFILEDGLAYSDVLDFEEMPGAAPSIDDYGIDTLTRTYSGRNSLLAAFLATWVNGSGVPLLTPDLVWPGMVATGRPSVSKGRAFSEVQVKFEGKVSNSPSLVKSTTKWTNGVVQAQGITSSTPPANGTAMVDYRASSTVREYVVGGVLLSPTYSSGGLSSAGVAISSIVAGADGIFNTATAHGLVAGNTFVASGVIGSVPDMNGVNTVKAVTDSDTFTVETTVTTGSSTGTIYKVTGLGMGFTIAAIRGFTKVGDNYYPITSIDQSSWLVTQKLKTFTQEQVGIWYKVTEEWGWELGQSPDVTAP